MSNRGLLHWNAAVFAILWAIWLECNIIIFKDKWDSIKFWVATWLHDAKDFDSFYFSVLTRDWSPFSFFVISLGGFLLHLSLVFLIINTSLFLIKNKINK